MKGLLLSLRKPEQQDIAILIQWLQDEGFVQNLYGMPYQTQGDVIKKVHGMLNQNAKDTTQTLTLLAENQKKEPIGLIIFQNLNWKNRNVEMNNAIGNAQYRQGLYGADLYLLGLTYAFTHLNLHKVFGYTYSSNTSAQKLNQFAAKVSGVLRKHVYKTGQFQDMVVFSILKRHFQEFLDTHKNGIAKKFIQSGMFQGLEI